MVGGIVHEVAVKHRFAGQAIDDFRIVHTTSDSDYLSSAALCDLIEQDAGCGGVRRIRCWSRALGGWQAIYGAGVYLPDLPALPGSSDEELLVKVLTVLVEPSLPGAGSPAPGIGGPPAVRHADSESALAWAVLRLEHKLSQMDSLTPPLQEQGECAAVPPAAPATPTGTGPSGPAVRKASSGDLDDTLSLMNGASPSVPFNGLDLAVLSANPLAIVVNNRLHSLEDNGTLLDFKGEYNLLRSSLSRTGKRVCARTDVASTHCLSEVLAQQPRCLYLVCHADHEVDSAGNADLFLCLEEPSTGVCDKVSLERLRALLTTDTAGGASASCHFGAGVVLLGACHSQEAGMVFVEAGCRHVVAIRAGEKVLDDDAANFARTFLFCLFQGYSVRMAFERGKGAVASAASPRAASNGGNRTSESGKFILLPEGEPHDEIPMLDLPSGELFELNPLPAHGPPTMPSPFVGRCIEVHTLARMLRRRRQAEVRLLTLFGRHGTGKSALARAVAQFLWQRRFLHDGVAYVDLEDVDTEAEIIGRLADALDMEFSRWKDVSRALQRWQGLVILDGVDNVVTTAPLHLANALAALMHAPLLQVMVTSVRPLSDAIGGGLNAEHPVEVGPLHSRDAARLLHALTADALQPEMRPVSKVHVLEQHPLIDCLEGLPARILRAAPLVRQGLSLDDLSQRTWTAAVDERGAALGRRPRASTGSQLPRAAVGTTAAVEPELRTLASDGSLLQTTAAATQALRQSKSDGSQPAAGSRTNLQASASGGSSSSLSSTIAEGADQGQQQRKAPEDSATSGSLARPRRRQGPRPDRSEMGRVSLPIAAQAPAAQLAVALPRMRFDSVASDFAPEASMAVVEEPSKAFAETPDLAFLYVEPLVSRVTGASPMEAPDAEEHGVSAVVPQPFRRPSWREAWRGAKAALQEPGAVGTFSLQPGTLDTFRHAVTGGVTGAGEAAAASPVVLVLSSCPCSPSGELPLEGNSGEVTWFSPSEAKAMMRGAKGECAKCVVLWSVGSQRTAAALVKHGVPAAVALDIPPTSVSARAFVGTFVAAIQAGAEVAAAVHKARTESGCTVTLTERREDGGGLERVSPLPGWRDGSGEGESAAAAPASSCPPRDVSLRLPHTNLHKVGSCDVAYLFSSDAPQPAPAATSTGAEEGDLPGRATSTMEDISEDGGPAIIGRRLAMHRILHACNAHALTAVYGPEGIGKCAIVHAAALHAVRRRLFPGGVFIVDLRGMRLMKEVVSALGDALGVSVERPSELARALTMRSQALIVLRRCELAIQTASKPFGWFLASILNIGATKVLLTSDLPLPVDMHVSAGRVDLGPMLPQDAAALLVCSLRDNGRPLRAEELGICVWAGAGTDTPEPQAAADAEEAAVIAAVASRHALRALGGIPAHVLTVARLMVAQPSLALDGALEEGWRQVTSCDSSRPAPKRMVRIGTSVASGLCNAGNGAGLPLSTSAGSHLNCLDSTRPFSRRGPDNAPKLTHINSCADSTAAASTPSDMEAAGDCAMEESLLPASLASTALPDPKPTTVPCTPLFPPTPVGPGQGATQAPEHPSAKAPTASAAAASSQGKGKERAEGIAHRSRQVRAATGSASAPAGATVDASAAVVAEVRELRILINDLAAVVKTLHNRPLAEPGLVMQRSILQRDVAGALEVQTRAVRHLTWAVVAAAASGIVACALVRK